MSRLVVERHGRRGVEWSGMSSIGVDRHSKAGSAALGAARLGLVGTRHGRLGIQQQTEKEIMTRLVCIPAFPGSLLKQFRPENRRRLKMGRAPRVLDASHLDCIRQLPCLKCGVDGLSQAAHVRMNQGSLGKKQAMGAKPDDCWAVPLCRDCHDEQHRGGEEFFWNEIGINPILVAQKLFSLSPDVMRMHSAVHAFIARIEQ